jgi:hypothetical protein
LILYRCVLTRQDEKRREEKRREEKRRGEWWVGDVTFPWVRNAVRGLLIYSLGTPG